MYPGCAAQIMHFAEAEADCDKALAREMSVKTLLRRGTARRGKRDLDGAQSDFKHALSLEPKNRCVCSLKHRHRMQNSAESGVAQNTSISHHSILG